MSDHTGNALDFIRTAILSLQHFAEQTDDDQELAAVQKCIVNLEAPPISATRPSGAPRVACDRGVRARTGR
jgi:hypothetical protein